MFQFLIRRLLWAVVLFIGVTLITYVLFFLVPADPARQAAGKSATAEDVDGHAPARARPAVYEQYGLFLDRLVSTARSAARTRTGGRQRDGRRRRPRSRPRSSSAARSSGCSSPCRSASSRRCGRGRSSTERDDLRADRHLGARSSGSGSAPVLRRLQARRGRRTSGYCDVISPPEARTAAVPSDWFYHMILPWTDLRDPVRGELRADDPRERDGHARTRTTSARPARRARPRAIVDPARTCCVTRCCPWSRCSASTSRSRSAAPSSPSRSSACPARPARAAQRLNLRLPDVQGVVVFATLAIIVLNLIVDVLYAYIDPRIRLS